MALVLQGLKEPPMTKVVTKITPIIELIGLIIGAFFVSTMNNEIIHQPLFGLSVP